VPSASAPAGPEANGDTPLLRLENIGKSFGPVQALSGITLDIPAGKVTALAGDNGAGKSTLIKCIAGIYQPTTGHLVWQGKPEHLHSPRDATNLGIATVYQDLALADNLDIVANMLLGRRSRWPRRSCRRPSSSSWTSQPPRWGSPRPSWSCR